MKVTPEQRSTLAKLRHLLAEVGFCIFPVAPWYRRHKSDFAAISNDGVMKHLFVVRAVGNGSISIRPFSSSMRSPRIETWLQWWHKHIHVRTSVWTNRCLPYTTHEGIESWLPYLSKRDQKEWAKLVR